MITNFRTLFTLAVAHGYYSADCRDFTFLVPTETAGKLRNGRLIARMRDGRLHLLYEADQNGAVLVPVTGTKLLFGMKLVNPLFYNVTDFAIPAPLYRNSSAQDSLDPPLGMGMTGYSLDAELQQESIFGIVELTVASSFYSTAPTFTIRFNPKKEVLKYYVVVSNYSTTEFNHLSLADNGYAEDGRSRIHFTRVPATAFTQDEIKPTTLAKKAGEKVVLFKSQSAEPRQEQARSKIQLSRNGDILIKHLPQAGSDHASGDVIIHISKP